MTSRRSAKGCCLQPAADHKHEGGSMKDGRKPCRREPRVAGVIPHLSSLILVSCRAFIAIALGLATTCTVAQTYPNKPIRFIMPYPVGGSIDLSGRIVMQQVGESVGQQVVVDNR